MVAVWSDDESPEQVAARIAEAHRDSPQWIDQFLTVMHRHLGARQLTRILEVWDLSGSDAAAMFDVSRQALSKWVATGVPAGRAPAVADLAAATDLLQRYLKADRIPAVVRRPIPAADDRSLIQLASTDPAAALAACRAMFDFSAVHA